MADTDLNKACVLHEIIQRSQCNYVTSLGAYLYKSEHAFPDWRERHYFVYRLQIQTEQESLLQYKVYFGKGIQNCK